MSDIHHPKVALVYDHLLTKFGGAEFVLQALHEAFPEAPLFTTVQNTATADWAKQFRVITSPLQKWLFFFQKRELLDLVTPITIEQYDLSQFDIIISVTSSASKGVITLPHQLHVCYLLDPTRYLYHDQKQLLKNHAFAGIWGVAFITHQVFRYLTWWDQVAATRPDKIIAISTVVAERSKKYYHRVVDAVLYPPVQEPTTVSDYETLNMPPFFLSLSRLMPYKRIDLVIQACINQQQLLVIAGEGREQKALIKLAGEQAYQRTATESIDAAITKAHQEHNHVVFLNACTESEKSHLLRSCEALLMPGIEDFGITAVEANSYGKPCILSKESGAAEVSVNGETSIFIEEQTIQSVETALKQFSKTSFSRSKMEKIAQTYSKPEFVRKFHNIVYQFFKEHSTISG